MVRGINQSYPTFKWVAMLVELFIAVSITVSYLTIGAVLHHTLNGWVNSFWTKDSMATYRDKLKSPTKCSCCTSQCMCNTMLSFLVFGIVFFIAMMDPQGFLDMLEKFASLTINLEVALFIFWMFMKSRNKENRNLKIPLPMPPFVYYLVYIIPVYFGFAVGYDIYNTIRDIVIEQTGSSQGKVITQGITGIAKNITGVVKNSTEHTLINSTLTSLINTELTTLSTTSLLLNDTIAQNISSTMPLL
ncbi:uncharacterized protein LOC123556145 [Mercenaria mercenaria]|uniref:uncharacterized protein LOC123556145 n=1 Tax=Mercenaria mercenaria TaxID=6596 RepID=UPI00234EE739|nr:uncharacterized protein LOC123556145 [Mercenaria mercenaria]